MLAADLVIIGTPIWLETTSRRSLGVPERMDAFLDEKDARGRMPSYGKASGSRVVVGNEDGAHHTADEINQSLAEVGGFTIPAGGVQTLKVG